MKLYNATFAEIISVLEERAMEISRREFVTAAVSSASVVAIPAYAMSGRAQHLLRLFKKEAPSELRR